MRHPVSTHSMLASRLLGPELPVSAKQCDQAHKVTDHRASLCKRLEACHAYPSGMARRRDAWLLPEAVSALTVNANKFHSQTKCNLFLHNRIIISLNIMRRCNVRTPVHVEAVQSEPVDSNRTWFTTSLTLVGKGPTSPSFCQYKQRVP